MTKPGIHRRIVRSRKKGRTPLSKLRTSDAVKTVLKHPRRLEELLAMLQDRDLLVRERAAAALTRLAEAYPARLLRVSGRIRESLLDDSAYVRWHLLYALGKLGSHFPSKAALFLPDIVARLEDGNRICRIMAAKAIGRVGARNPRIIKDVFQNLKKEIPHPIARSLPAS